MARKAKGAEQRAGKKASQTTALDFEAEVARPQMSTSRPQRGGRAATSERQKATEAQIRNTESCIAPPLLHHLNECSNLFTPQRHFSSRLLFFFVQLPARPIPARFSHHWRPSSYNACEEKRLLRNSRRRSCI